MKTIPLDVYYKDVYCKDLDYKKVGCSSLDRGNKGLGNINYEEKRLEIPPFAMPKIHKLPEIPFLPPPILHPHELQRALFEIGIII